MYTKQYARKVTRKLLTQAYERGGFYKNELNQKEKLAIDTRWCDLDWRVRNSNQTKKGRWENWDAEKRAIEAMLFPAY